MVWVSGDRWGESANMVPNDIYLDLWYTYTQGATISFRDPDYVLFSPASV